MFESLKKITHKTSLIQTEASSQNIEESVQGWLVQENFSVTKAPDNASSFRYFARRDKAPAFSVFQEKDRKDSVVVESWVTFEGLEKQKATWIFVEGPNFLLDLRLQFELKGLSYSIQPPDFNNNKPARIFFAKRVYFDRLSKQMILQTSLEVMHTFAFVVLAVQRYIASHPQTKDNIPTYLR